MAMMPRMPPVRMTHVLFDIATATRIESMAKTMSVSSTLTTVAQNAVSPSIARAGFGAPPVVPLFAAVKKCEYGRYSRYAAPASLTQLEFDEVDREQCRNGSEEEGAQDAVPKGLLLLVFRQAEDENGQNQRIVST